MFNTTSLIGFDIPEDSLSSDEVTERAEAAHAEYVRLSELCDESLRAKMRELVIAKFGRDAHKMGAARLVLSLNLMVGLCCEHSERVDRFVVDALTWRILALTSN